MPSFEEIRALSMVCLDEGLETMLLKIAVRYEPGTGKVKLNGFRGPYGTVCNPGTSYEDEKGPGKVYVVSFNVNEVYAYTTREIEKRLSKSGLVSPCCKKPFKLTRNGASCSKCRKKWDA